MIGKENKDRVDENEIDLETESSESGVSVPEVEIARSVKKRRMLFVGIIISIIVVIALGCFAYSAFLLKEPDESLLLGRITWSDVVGGETFYYEFNKDGGFITSIGSVEYQGHYKKSEGDGEKQLGVDISIGSFYASSAAGNAVYSISGSRILGNQTMTCSYGEDYEFTLSQTNNESFTMPLPEDFSPNEELLGTWVFNKGSESDKIIIRDDGSITWEIREKTMNASAKYNGIYCVEDSYINFTYNVGEDVTVPWSYTLSGDTLSILGNDYVREVSGE